MLLLPKLYPCRGSDYRDSFPSLKNLSKSPKRSFYPPRSEKVRKVAGGYPISRGDKKDNLGIFALSVKCPKDNVWCSFSHNLSDRWCFFKGKVLFPLFMELIKIYPTFSFSFNACFWVLACEFQDLDFAVFPCYFSRFA